MAKEKHDDNHQRNPFIWFLFAIVIPLFVVFILIIFILMIAGVDTGSWVKEKFSDTPVISHLVSSEKEKEQADQLERAKGTIKKQKDELDNLSKEIDSLEDIVADLELENKRLSNRTTDEAEDETLETNDSKQTEEIKKISASFRKMDPEKAAEIVEILQRDLAIQVLNQLSGDVRGKIFEAMKPKLAADLMQDMMRQ